MSLILRGEVKICTNLEEYTKYGSKKFVGDLRICNTVIGTVRTYDTTVDKNAILLKVNKKNFIWLNKVTFPIKLLKTSPSLNNLFFVEEKSFEQGHPDKKLSKTLGIHPGITK